MEIFFATINLQLCLYETTIINADEDVYNIYAEISFNPKTNMLFDLRFFFHIKRSLVGSVQKK